MKKKLFFWMKEFFNLLKIIGIKKSQKDLKVWIQFHLLWNHLKKKRGKNYIPFFYFIFQPRKKTKEITLYPFLKKREKEIHQIKRESVVLWNFKKKILLFHFFISPTPSSSVSNLFLFSPFSFFYLFLKFLKSKKQTTNYNLWWST